MLQSGQNCFRTGYIKLPGTSRNLFGVRTVQLGIGGILSDPGHLTLNTDWNVSHWRARSTRYYYKCCVLYMMSVPGNNGVKPSFSFLIFWKVAHVCVHSSYPIILKVWYFLTTEAWALLVCYFQNVSKYGKRSAWQRGLAKAGDRCAPGIPVVKYLFYNMEMCGGWTLRVRGYFSKLVISLDVVNCGRGLWIEFKFFHVT